MKKLLTLLMVLLLAGSVWAADSDTVDITMTLTETFTVDVAEASLTFDILTTDTGMTAGQPINITYTSLSEVKLDVSAPTGGTGDWDACVAGNCLYMQYVSASESGGHAYNTGTPFVVNSTPKEIANVTTGDCVYNVLMDADAVNASTLPGTHTGTLLVEGRL